MRILIFLGIVIVLLLGSFIQVPPQVAYSQIIEGYFLGYNAYVVPSDIEPRIMQAAISLKGYYGDLIQICDGVEDEIEIVNAVEATEIHPFPGDPVGYSGKMASVKVLPGTIVISPAGLQFPSVEDFLFDASATVISNRSDEESTGHDTITIDSAMNCEFRFNTIGSTVDSSHAAVRIKPVNHVPHSTTVGVVSTKFFISAMAKVSKPNEGYGIYLDSSVASISASDFEVYEINQFNTGISGSGKYGTINNHGRFMFIHDTVTAFRDSPNVWRDNKFEFYVEAPTGEADIGLDVYSVEGNEYALFLDRNVGLSQSVILEAGASNNRIYLNSAAKTKGIIDYARNQCNVFLPFAEGARVYNNKNQTIPSSSWTPLGFNSEHDDLDGLHDVVIDNSRIYIKIPGTYEIIGNIVFEPSPYGSRAVSIVANGGVWWGYSQVQPTQSSTTGLSVMTQVYLNAGDYVECWVYHNKGGNLDVGFYGNFSPEFSIRRIGG